MAKKIIHICLIMIFLGFSTQMAVAFFTDSQTVLYAEKEDSPKDEKASFDDLKYTQSELPLFEKVNLSSQVGITHLPGNTNRGYLHDSEIPPDFSC